jgi:hypothetical protein
LQPKAARTEGPPEGASAPLNQSREALLAVRTLRAAGHPVRNAPIAGCSAQTSRLTRALWRAARNSDRLDDQAPRPAPRCSMSQVGQSTRSWIWCTAHKRPRPGPAALWRRVAEVPRPMAAPEADHLDSEGDRWVSGVVGR